MTTTKNMLLIVTLFSGVTSQATTIPVSDLTAFTVAMQTAQPDDVILLAPGLYNRPDGALDFTPDTGARKIIIRAAGPGVEFRCSPTCFVERMQSVRIEGIRITGYMNGSAWSHVDFRNVDFDDSARIGQQNLGILLKCGPPNSRTVTTPVETVLVGCRDILIEDSTFTQATGLPNSGDMALDFVAGERITIRGNVAHNLARGLLQTKGDTVDVLVEGNHLKQAGLRGIQVGGSSVENGIGRYWRRDPSIAKHETSNVTIRNNYIEGGAACITLSTFGNVTITRNTCRGQTAFLFRFLNEAGNVAVPNQGAAIERNAFVGFAGAEMVNFGGLIDWTTISRGVNLYAGFTPGSWPAGAVVTIPELVRASVELDANGVVLGELAGNYGRQSSGGPGSQPNPNPPPVGLGPIYVLSLATLEGDGIYHTAQEVVNAIVEAVSVVRFVPSTGGIELVRDENGTVVAITLRGSATEVGVSASVGTDGNN